MSFVIAAPEALVAVASDLAGIGSALAEANAAALAPTTALLAAGADEVSAAIAALFGAHGQAYQTVSAQASAFHAQFVQALTGGGGAYAAAEAANVSAAQSTDQRLLDLINGPTQALLGRPLIGDGANGGPGQDGGPGGLLYGNGGNGGTSTTAGVAGGPTRATSPAVGALCTGSAGATVADQPAGIPSVGPGAGSTVSPVTDQRTAGSGQDGRVDRVEQRRHGGGLGGRIGAPPGGQRLHEPTMKRRRLGARRLIGPAVRAEQRSDCRRDLIGTGGQQARRVGRRSRVGPSDRRAEIG